MAACPGGSLVRLFVVIATLAVATTGAVRAEDLLPAQNQNAAGVSMTLVPSAAFDTANDPIRPLWGNGPGSTYSQELMGVAHKFLQRHGVPCRLVLKVGSPRDMGEVATCQDEREWALFWLED